MVLVSAVAHAGFFRGISNVLMTMQHLWSNRLLALKIPFRLREIFSSEGIFNS